MIGKILAFTDSEGKAHGTLEAAQKSELIILLRQNQPVTSVGENDLISDWALKNKDKIVDILTTKPNSLTKARRINGGTKTRAKKSTRHEAEQFKMPLEDNPKDAA